MASLGFKYELLKDKIFLHTNTSNKFLLPTFNDRYWQPGGNPDLKPESAFGSDLGFETFILKSPDKKQLLTADVTGYTYKINDLIQWIYADGKSYVTPVNQKEVWSRGLEASMKYEYRWNNFSVFISAFYNLSVSTIVRSEDNLTDIIGNQMMYVPVHSAKGYLNIGYKKYFVSYSLCFTGSRYTTDDENPYDMMPSYLISNIYIGKEFKLKDFTGSIQFKIMNLFDEQYQVVQAYPMNGRAYFISLTFGINKHN
jgi:iron complex outermembrane receptor protein